MISIINHLKNRFIILSAPKLLSGIVILSLFLFQANAQEQSQDESKMQQKLEFEQSFQQMLKDPSNVDTTLQYARLAVSLGNYEAAIPPLERILIFNPNLPKIKLELGVLYYRLDSMKMAKSYFEDAARSVDVSEEIRASATEYLQKIKG